MASYKDTKSRELPEITKTVPDPYFTFNHVSALFKLRLQDFSAVTDGFVGMDCAAGCRGIGLSQNCFFMGEDVKAAFAVVLPHAAERKTSLKCPLSRASK